MEYTEVFKELNIDLNTAQSIHRYSPVFKCILENQSVVLKTTKSKADSAEKLFQWEEYLNNRILINGFQWGSYEEDLYDELHEDINTIKERYTGEVEQEILKELENRIRFYINDKFSTLIDPDNSGHIPRILDLALALLLFHNEMDTAPPRAFNIEEWNSLKKGYFKHIELSQLEKDLWKKMLEFVYIDEVIWAIVDLEDDESEKQKEFIKSLVRLNIGKYKL